MASRILLVSALAAILIIGIVSCQEQEESNDIIPDISSQAPTENVSPAGSDANVPEVVTEAPPPSGSTVFTRLIHDIFQIPIQVLKAVRNMLSNSAQKQEKPANQ